VKGNIMTDEQLQAIKARRAAADMVTILEAVSTYPLHKMADAYFAEFVGEDIDALLAEVDRLTAQIAKGAQP